MMKIKLVVPPYILKDKYLFSVPLGLLQIAGQIKPYNYDVSLIDFIYLLRTKQLNIDIDIYRRCAEIIMQDKPDVVGFTTVSLTYPPTINIAKYCKEINPEVIVIFGGPQATVTYHETLSKFSFVDFVVRGEGDFTFVELINAIVNNEQDFSGIQGISYIDKGNGKIVTTPERPVVDNLDLLAMPDYSIIPDINVYRSESLDGKFAALVDSGRGCVFDCKFCSSRLVWGRKARYKSIDRVFKEIDILLNDYGADEIYLVHDLFSARRSYVKEFCQRILDENRRIDWHCRCRVDTVDRELLALMKEAGCTKVIYGIESGSESTLKNMNKKINLEKIEEALKVTQEFGFSPTNFFILGYPTETFEDFEQTLQLMAKSFILTQSKPTMMVLSPLSKTDVYNQFKDRLMFTQKYNNEDGINFINKKLLHKDMELITRHSEIFSSFYNIIPYHVPLDLIYKVEKHLGSLLLYYGNSLVLLTGLLGIKYYTLIEKWAEFEGKDSIEEFYQYASSLVLQSAESLPYMHEILKYEKTIARVGRKNVSLERVNPIDWDIISEVGFDKVEIAVSKYTQIEKFSFDIPLILKNIKANRLIKEVNLKETYMFFVPSEMGCKTFCVSRNIFDLYTTIGSFNRLNKLFEKFAGTGQTIDYGKSVVSSLNKAGLVGLEYKIS